MPNSVKKSLNKSLNVRSLKVVLTCSFGLLFTALVYSNLKDHGFSLDIKKTLTNLSFSYLALAIFSFLIIHYLRTARFMLFIKNSHKKNSKNSGNSLTAAASTKALKEALKAKPKKAKPKLTSLTPTQLNKSFLVVLASFPLAFFFTGTGLIFRSIFLKRIIAFPVTASVSFFTFEKALDLLVIVGLFALLGLDLGLSYFNSLYSGTDSGIAAATNFSSNNFIYLPVSILVLLSGLFFLLYQREFFIRLFIKLIYSLSKKLSWTRKLYKLNLILSPSLSLPQLIKIFFFTLFIWIFEYIFILNLILSFLPALGIFSGVYPSWIIFVLLQLLIIFPIAPSGVGTWEGAFLVSQKILNSKFSEFSEFSRQLEQVNFLTLALASHLVLVLLFLVLFLGAFFVLNLKISLKLSELRSTLKRKT